MRLLLIRHADPEYINDSLTRKGRQEASALADYLVHSEDSRPTHLYTSPKGRARATAKYAERALGLKAEVEDWTRELSHWPRLSGGGGEKSLGGARAGEGGLALWDTAGEEPVVRSSAARACVASQLAGDGMMTRVAADFEEISASSDSFLARHGYVRESGSYRVVRRNRDVVAVFMHGGLGLTWLSVLLGLPAMTVYTGFWLAPSSVTSILFDERSPDFATPRALAIGDLPHLEKAGLSLSLSKYERPNKYKEVPGSRARVSGIKANFF